MTGEIGPLSASAPSSAPADPARDPEEARRLRDAAQQFEGLLLNMLLKAMRATVPRSELYGDSSELRMYEEIRDEELSRSMARSGSLGLAPVIERQLGGDPEATQRLRSALSEAREAGRRAQLVEHAPTSPSGAPPIRTDEEEMP